MTKDILVESLEQDYFIENDFENYNDLNDDCIDASDSNGVSQDHENTVSNGEDCSNGEPNDTLKAVSAHNTENTVSSHNDTTASHDGVSKASKKTAKKKTSKFKHLTFSDYGINSDENGINMEYYNHVEEPSKTGAEESAKETMQHSRKWCTIIDSIYDKEKKQLYVKSHTKIKVLIVCSSALRCVDVIRSLKKGLHQNVQVAKLFARHMKANQQIKVLKEGKFLVGVGTPARIVKIMQQDTDAIPLKKLDYVLVDSSYRDAKQMSILDLPDTGIDLKNLYEIIKDPDNGSAAQVYAI